MHSNRDAKKIARRRELPAAAAVAAVMVDPEQLSAYRLSTEKKLFRTTATRRIWNRSGSRIASTNKNHYNNDFVCAEHLFFRTSPKHYVTLLIHRTHFPKIPQKRSCHEGN